MDDDFTGEEIEVDDGVLMEDAEQAPDDAYEELETVDPLSEDDQLSETDGGDQQVDPEVINDNTATLDTTVSVASGDRVIITLVDGEPIVTGVVGGGDNMAEDVQSALSNAQIAANAAASAQTSAKEAVNGLSEVEKVVGTLNWIADHGRYVNQAGQMFDSSKIYYTRSGTSPNYVYTMVDNPVAADIASYYLLVVDESVQNFIASHVYLQNDGLYVTTDSTTGYKVRIDGDSMDVLDTSGTIVASFGTSIALGKAATRVTYQAGNSLTDGSGMQMTVRANSQDIGRDFFGLASDGGGGNHELRATFVRGSATPHYTVQASNTTTSGSNASLDLEGGQVSPYASLYAVNGSNSHYSQLEVLPSQIQLNNGSWSNDIPTVDAYFGQDGIVCYGEVTSIDANNNSHDLTGKVDKSGDTMTGTLGFANSSALPSFTGTSGFYPIVLNNSFANDGVLAYTTPANFLSALGIATTPTSTTTVSDILTMASGYTATSAQFIELNGVAMLSLVFKKTTAGSGTQTVATLKSGKSPGMYILGSTTLSFCGITAGGTVQVSGSVTANTDYRLHFTYIVG